MGTGTEPDWAMAGDALWRNARAKLGPRYNVFGKLAAITIDLVFPSWDDPLLTLRQATTNPTVIQAQPDNTCLEPYRGRQ